jgi:predicted PurR-regulated permease PerM
VSGGRDPSTLWGFTARLLLTILLVALALFLWVVRDAVLLGFAAVLLAIAVHGVADALMKVTPLPRLAALGLGALLIIAILTGILWLFGAQLSAELSGVFDRLPSAWEQAKETLQGNPVGAAVVSEIQHLTSGDSGGSAIDMISSAGGFALPAASGMTTALLVFFTAAFLTSSASVYRRGALLLIPKGPDEKVGAALDYSALALKKWLLGITVDMMIITVLLAIALWALGIPAFIGLALLAGFSQFVPTVGPLIAAIPGILLAFTIGPMTALYTAAAYLVISQLEANLIYPIIQKKAASIPPALNLVAILAFGMLFGPLGVLLATPILIVVTVWITKLYVQDTLGKDASIPGD